MTYQWVAHQAGPNSWWWCVEDEDGNHFLIYNGGFQNGGDAQQVAERIAARLNKTHPVTELPEDIYQIEEQPWQEQLL